MNVLEILDKVVTFIQNAGAIGVVVACVLMCLESIFPIIPLLALVTINMIVMGKTVGFIVSWFFTIMGCIISYFIFKKGFGKKFDKLTEDKVTLQKYKKVFKNISTGKLVLIIAMPFTPAFVVNIVAGLLKIDFKKFFIALLIGKLSMVYFLGFVGSSIVESIKDPTILLRIFVIMGAAYVIYLVVNKFLKID